MASKNASNNLEKIVSYILREMGDLSKPVNIYPYRNNIPKVLEQKEIAIGIKYNDNKEFKVYNNKHLFRLNSFLYNFFNIRHDGVKYFYDSIHLRDENINSLSFFFDIISPTKSIGIGMESHQVPSFSDLNSENQIAESFAGCLRGLSID